jgi:hypothetical protein
VLGVETRYTRELVFEAIGRMVTADSREITRAAAQLTTLAITTTAYLAERLRLAAGTAGRQLASTDSSGT